jgi:hypothetical protein
MQCGSPACSVVMFAVVGFCLLFQIYISNKWSSRPVRYVNIEECIWKYMYFICSSPSRTLFYVWHVCRQRSTPLTFVWQFIAERRSGLAVVTSLRYLTLFTIHVHITALLRTTKRCLDHMRKTPQSPFQWRDSVCCLWVVLSMRRGKIEPCDWLVKEVCTMACWWRTANWPTARTSRRSDEWKV